jgi:hypothetical protein
MAKPMLVTLPFVLLLLDFWPLKRWNRQEAARRPVLESSEISEISRKKKNKENRKDKPKGLSSNPEEKSSYRANSQNILYLVQEKIPFFILAGLFCLITLVAQIQGGASPDIEELPPVDS